MEKPRSFFKHKGKPGKRQDTNRKLQKSEVTFWKRQDTNGELEKGKLTS